MMNKLSERRDKHIKVSNTLCCLSNNQIKNMLLNSKSIHRGIGGKSSCIAVNSIPVFVKQIPISDLELKDENYMSTANVFNLPMCYQYGIGSTGFGVWRELAAHIMTTNWVISGVSYNFPIMYHWRILDSPNNKVISDEEQMTLEKDKLYWENNESIFNKIKLGILASHHIYLFMEFIPYNLSDWLKNRLASRDSESWDSVIRIEKQMKFVNEFMGSQKFLHMDAHFENILTDGDNLYYSDFGLAISDQFDLSKEEKKFSHENIYYDKASGVVNLLHCILTVLSENELLQKSKLVQGIRGDQLDFENDIKSFELIIQGYVEGKITSKIKIIDNLIKKYAKIALAMNGFYQSIQKNKSTIFPSDEVKQYFTEIGIQDDQHL